MEQPAGSQAVLILGVISVVKALVPLVLKLIASNANEKMTAIWKPNAGLLWWVGNLAIWLPLAIMWLLVSPGSGLVDPFLQLTLYGGLYLGALLVLVNAIIFIAASDDGKSTLYLLLSVLIDGAGVAGTFLKYEEAEAYLRWVEPATEKVEVEEEEEEEPQKESKGDDEEVEEEIENGGEIIVEEESEDEIDLTDDSPFTDFHAVTY